MPEQMTPDDLAAPRLYDDLDPVRLNLWLRSNVGDIPDVDEVLLFTNSISHMNYLLKAGKTQLVLRREMTGTRALNAHDLKREHRGLERLQPFYPLCPKVLGYCDDPNVLGSKFLVMDRMDGVVLGAELPDGFNLTEKQAAKLCEHVVDAQVKLHRVDIERAELAGFGTANGYVERQINSWINRFSKARTNDVADCEDIMEWLQDNLPEEDENDPVAFLHNDYKISNIVIDEKNHSKVVGVLDWENASVGHPLMDVGITLANWVTADDDESLQPLRPGPTHLSGMMTRADYIARYTKKSGVDTRDILYYQVYGLFRRIGQLQQIYYRFAKGMIRNPMFADYGKWVNSFSEYTDTLLD